ncbi:MAG: hypothetical protein C0404_14910 [Verrucomicrobia bacterium]|nr:hypothetical protein [Verrucomicrobiota bacterium]
MRPAIRAASAPGSITTPCPASPARMKQLDWNSPTTRVSTFMAWTLLPMKWLAKKKVLTIPDKLCKSSSMRIVVTAGPTREAIDPVRFLSNRSSGRMGYAIAAAAARRGHKVTLVSGPVSLARPAGVRIVQVVAAAEMLAAVKKHLPGSDVLVMAAAVADWRPAVVAREKMKKGRSAVMTLRLVRTPDILAWAGGIKGTRLIVGFAAETERMLREAGRKLVEKNVDLIVANNVKEMGAGFDVETNRVTLVFPGGRVCPWPMMTKTRVAGRLVREIEEMCRKMAAGSSKT